MKLYIKQSKLTFYLNLILIISILALYAYIGFTQKENTQFDNLQPDNIQLEHTQPENAHPVRPSAKLHTYTITNPYENVDWDTYGQYKANLHAHSTNSDGSNLTKEMVEDHYAKGYDILSMTDHNYLALGWDKASTGRLSTERKAEIEAGIGRKGRGMIDIGSSNEHSHSDHINSFFADFNNTSGADMAGTIQSVEELGGITHINHPGRYTGGSKGGRKGRAASNNPETIKKYTNLFMVYDSCVGMEIINKIDHHTRSDRILWDNILKETMPRGRFVWGFSNDDTHSLNATGYAWNVMLLPSLSEKETRIAMETGAFYAVSRVSRPDGINTALPNGDRMPGSGNKSTLYLLEQTTPRIVKIAVSQEDAAISISGENCDLIEWIADGEVIATGNSLSVNEYQDHINSYVRAQLKSETGIAFTQPFGIKRNNP